MAFQDLVGADCTGSNAVLKVAEHVGGDRSLQQVRVRGGPSRPGPADTLSRSRHTGRCWVSRGRGPAAAGRRRTPLWPGAHRCGASLSMLSHVCA
jgi:hypothetical protein